MNIVILRTRKNRNRPSIDMITTVSSLPIYGILFRTVSHLTQFIFFLYFFFWHPFRNRMSLSANSDGVYIIILSVKRGNFFLTFPLSQKVNAYNSGHFLKSRQKRNKATLYGCLLLRYDATGN